MQGEYVICGDGWRLEAMRKLARRLGVHDRVDFPGWLGGEQLAEQLANASIVVVPSLWPEPFGLVGLEAMASGRPRTVAVLLKHRQLPLSSVDRDGEGNSDICSNDADSTRSRPAALAGVMGALIGIAAAVIGATTRMVAERLHST